MVDERISIVIPALNEAEIIADTLQSLAPLRRRGHEVIVVDGGSADATVALARPHADRVFTTGKGRAAQMNAGARCARHAILLFLHADTRLPQQADAMIARALGDGSRSWGRFDIRLSGAGHLLRVVETAVNWRSALTFVATGDQAIFVRRDLFERAGGYPAIPLMEDVALSKKLRRLSRPCRLRCRVVTSSRRWEERGVVSTIVLMWRLRAAYFLGADPGSLARAYYGKVGNALKYPGARILLFVKEPVPGRVKTRLIPALGEVGALDLHVRLLADRMKLLSRTTLCRSELWVDGDPRHPAFDAFAGPRRLQEGDDLGERMYHAAVDALGSADCVIIIGGDCPAVDEDYLAGALSLLAEGTDAVVGPAADGGYVLIGLRRAGAALFQGIAWGTDRVLTGTLERLRRLGYRHALLPELHDVDRPEDLARLPLETTGAVKTAG